MLCGCLALACLFQKGCPFKLAWFISLPIHANAIERVLQGFAGACVRHTSLGELSTLSTFGVQDYLL
jgi:hypothetical protein